MPIPNKANARRVARVAGGPEPLTYGDICFKSVEAGELVSELTNGRLNADSGVHLDPDLRREAYKRQQGWRPLFGQAGNAQQQLEHEGIEPGDLFLFFGIFQHVKKTDKGYRYDSRGPWMHALWGWLQIGEVYKPSLGDKVGNWAQYHDHVKYADGYTENNTLYVASRQLDLGYGLVVPGAGVFSALEDEVILTEPEQQRASDWRLPRWFYPFFRGRKRRPLTGFPTRKHWGYDRDWAYASRRTYGQEFILCLDQYPEAGKWLRDLFRAAA